MIAEHPKINEWLSAVERHMMSTLATGLGRAIAGLRAWMADKGATAAFMDWCDQYQVRRGTTRPLTAGHHGRASCSARQN